MEISIKDYILAIITQDPSLVQGCGCPVFVARESQELQRLTLMLARILGGNIHDLENGVFIICKH